MEFNHKIVLANGQEISNLGLNGNNFVSLSPISENIFEDNLSPVTIYADGISEVHENMELVQITRVGAEHWFILRDITQKELDEIRLRADVDFIAMMTDIEL